MLLQRHKEILKLLAQEKIVKTQQIAEVFANVSNREISYHQRQIKNLQEKKAIAQAAAQLIDDGDTLALCGGTSVLMMMDYLQEKRDLTILTNSLQIVTHIPKSSVKQIYLAGGLFNGERMLTDGSLAQQFFSNFCSDKAVLSTAGISAKLGITDYREAASNVLREMMRISRQTILLMDYSKIGVSTLRKVGDAQDVHYLITDSNAPAQELSALRALVGTVIVAPLP